MLDLDALAKNATDAVAHQHPPVDELRRRVDTRRNNRYMIAKVGGVGLVFAVVFAGFMFNRSSTTPVSTTDGLVENEARSEFDVPEPWDVIVFMDSDATDEELAAVGQILEDSDPVSAFTFFSKQEMFDEFEAEFGEDEPGLVETVSVKTMPTSFRLVVDDVADPVIALLSEQPGVLSIIGDGSELPRPITVFGSPIFDRRESVRLFIASREGYDEAFRRCMARAGFESVEPQTVGFWPKEYLDALDDSTDAEYAEEWGFAVTSVNEATLPRQAGPNPAVLDEDDPYYAAAFGGLLGDGCAGESNDVWNDGERELNRAWDRVEETLSEFAVDQRVIDHYSDWSSCMDEKGHDASSPIDAYDQTVRGYTSWKSGELVTTEQKLRAEEQSLAVATVECGGSSSVLISMQLAQVWNEYAENGWGENKYRVNDPDCRIEGHQFSAQLLSELATLDEPNADVERCFGS